MRIADRTACDMLERYNYEYIGMQNLVTQFASKSRFPVTDDQFDKAVMGAIKALMQYQAAWDDITASCLTKDSICKLSYSSADFLMRELEFDFDQTPYETKPLDNPDKLEKLDITYSALKDMVINITKADYNEQRLAILIDSMVDAFIEFQHEFHDMVHVEPGQQADAKYNIKIFTIKGEAEKMEIVDKAIISDEDCKELENAWYSYSALKDLVTEAPSAYAMDRYEVAYAKYNKLWSKILNDYFDGKYTTGNYSWNCDFITKTVTITL